MKLPLLLGLAVASLATPALADRDRYDRGDRYRGSSRSHTDWSFSFGFGGNSGYRDYSYADFSIGRGRSYGGYRGYDNLCDWPAPRPVYVQPAPVYYQPAPVYCPPPAVYYSPAPVYRCDPYVNYGGYRYHGGYGYRGGYRCD